MMVKHSQGMNNPPLAIILANQPVIPFGSATHDCALALSQHFRRIRSARHLLQPKRGDPGETSLILHSLIRKPRREQERSAKGLKGDRRPTSANSLSSYPAVFEGTNFGKSHEAVSKRVRLAGFVNMQARNRHFLFRDVVRANHRRPSSSMAAVWCRLTLRTLADVQGVDEVNFA